MDLAIINDLFSNIIKSSSFFLFQDVIFYKPI